jgi:hypothetical protein
MKLNTINSPLIKNLHKKGKNKNTIIVLTALLCITTAGLILRFYNLGASSVWFDEAISAITAHTLIEQEAQTAPAAAIEYGRSILNINLIALSFKLFGYTTLAGRIPAALFGTLSIPTAYLLGKKIKGARFALLLAFFVAFATVQITWSRQIRFYQQLQFFFLLALYLNERFLDKPTWKNLLLLMLPTVALPLTDRNFGYILTAPIVLWFLIEKATWLQEKLTNIRRHIKLKNIAGTAALTLTVIAVLTVTSASTVASNAIATIETKTNYIGQTNYLKEYTAYLNSEAGFLTLLAIPGAILGTLERKRNLFYTTAFLFHLYIISYNIPWMQHRYAFPLFPLLFILALLTIEFTAKKTQQIIQNKQNLHHKKTLKTIAPTLIIATFLASTITAANFTFLPKEHYNLGFTAPQGEFQPAYEYIKQNWQQQDVIISTLTPVTWFYLQRSDYWLSFSIVGFPELPDQDGFTNAKVIKHKQDLQAVMNNNSGWIVIDLMGMSRADTETLTYITQNLNLITQISGADKGVWVYRWTTPQQPQQQNNTTTKPQTPTP